MFLTGAAAYVDLYWIPLGADGPPVVRWSGRIYEAILARHQRRAANELYHSALLVGLGLDLYAIEMGPAWGNGRATRGVVATGAVGAPWLGRSRLFRYEVRCWRNGTIPDLSCAAGPAQRLSTSVVAARRIVELAPTFPTATWGRDELGAGEMWNSNSLTAWLLAGSDHDIGAIRLPPSGRAPGWYAGLAVAARPHPQLV